MPPQSSNTIEAMERQRPLLQHEHHLSPAGGDTSKPVVGTFQNSTPVPSPTEMMPSSFTTIPSSVPAAPSRSSHRSGRWSPEEKILFLHGLRTVGKGRWKKISVFLPHRTLVQIKSHAQKVLKRQQAGENVFRRLDEARGILDSLLSQAARDRQQRAIAPKPDGDVIAAAALCELSCWDKKQKTVC